MLIEYTPEVLADCAHVLLHSPEDSPEYRNAQTLMAARPRPKRRFEEARDRDIFSLAQMMLQDTEQPLPKMKIYRFLGTVHNLCSRRITEIIKEQAERHPEYISKRIAA
ncbi:MAG: hypothetical protein V7700_16435 [Halioglobus sp.]